MIYKRKRYIIKIIQLIFLFSLSLICFSCNNVSMKNNGIVNKVKKNIVIWTSGEDYKNETYLKSLKEKFIDINFDMQYVSSSVIASKIKEEGSSTTCDIILSEEYSYLDMISDNLVNLSDIIDFSIFLDDIVPKSRKWTPELKNGGCIMINKKLLDKKGIDIPFSYDDLLKNEYKNIISMPNPASSGTGYMFLRQLTNEWGEEKAFNYFNQLNENILQWTTSGSGVVNQLIQGEVAIAIGMTSQGVTEKNQGLDINITFFEEGSPYSMYGNAIVQKDNISDELIEVFKYLSTDLCKQNNKLYFPDQIFKGFTPNILGWPENITYGDMKNDTRIEKERLLKKWTLS